MADKFEPAKVSYDPGGDRTGTHRVSYWNDPEWEPRLRRALADARARRWGATGRARVEHPTRGSVVVPCDSNFAALLCAAEYWDCDWRDIRGAKVWAAKPGDGPVVMPKEFCKTKQTGETKNHAE
ncbi:MAG: hypothetical protein LIO54_03500 [Oscillospiraceae bacterium]|nr:hypothetical protein [Oscillospiraceae bacterium]